MRAYRQRLVAILLAVAVAGAAVEASVAPPGFAGPVLEPLEELPVAPGVRLQTYAFTGDAGVSRVYVLSAKLRGAPVRIRTTSPGPGGGVLGLASVPMQAASVTAGARSTVVAAVNGDFWTGPPLAGVPYHLQIREGELLSSPQPVGAAWGLTSEGQMLLEPVRMDAVIWTAGGSRSRLLAVNKPRGPQALVLYSPSWAASTRTGPGGTEAVIAALTPPLPLRAGVTYAGTVSAVVEGPGDTAIPPGSLVLSGAGEAAQWMARVLRPGTAVRLRIDLWGESGRTWNDVIEAIGGGPGSLLRNGRPDPGLPSVEGVHPRTALGVRGDELLLVAVDGRQPPYSTGVTLEELAWILRGLGATDGLNLDGGGSTTLLARLPGEPGLRLVNRPSDGSERAVGNALAVVSTAAPTGVLHHVFLRPSRLVLLQGSAWPLRVLGADDVLAPVAVDPGTVRWAVEGGVAEVDAAGRLRARRPGEGWVVASAGGVTARVPVRVVGAPDRVQIEPDPVVVDRGGAAEFVVRAWHEGQELLVSPELFDCRISGVAGTRIEGHDLVRAGPSAGGEGLLTCGRPGLAPASARLVVGKPPVLAGGLRRPLARAGPRRAGTGVGTRGPAAASGEARDLLPGACLRLYRGPRGYPGRLRGLAGRPAPGWPAS
ncbi:MAG: phosphodiester glycosidase family protein [Limnochordaceae bacterium]|nr:phosphodiester glycosidase family protein [Limnochordaceae bacterium]